MDTLGNGELSVAVRCYMPQQLTSDPAQLIRPTIGLREQEVLRAWFLCESKEAAARELFVSVNTVKKHIERVRAKYAAVGRPAPTQALLLIRAIQDGWIDVRLW